MEFALNIIYGGELNASKALSPFVRNMRKIIKDTFTSFENLGCEAIWLDCDFKFPLDLLKARKINLFHQ